MQFLSSASSTHTIFLTFIIFGEKITDKNPTNDHMTMNHIFHDDEYQTKSNFIIVISNKIIHIHTYIDCIFILPFSVSVIPLISYFSFFKSFLCSSGIIYRYMCMYLCLKCIHMWYGYV